jgi:H+-transporting ATPase
VLTHPGLGDVVFAVREGRIAFGRLITYSLNMLVKKVEIVLFLAAGLAWTGHAILTPVLMVLMLITNDFLAMSLTTDRASPSPVPSHWRMRNITITALILGPCKLAFSVAMLAIGMYWFQLQMAQLQTLAFVTIVIGAQAVMYVVRERRRLWASRPGKWVFAMSAVDIALASGLALTGTLMAPLPWQALVIVLAVACAFALVLDQVKLTTLRTFAIT